MLRLFVTFVAFLSLLTASVSRPFLSSPRASEESEEKESKEAAKKPVEEASFRHHRVRVPKPPLRGTTQPIALQLPTTRAGGLTPAAPPDLPRRLL